MNNVADSYDGELVVHVDELSIRLTRGPDTFRIELPYPPFYVFDYNNGLFIFNNIAEIMNSKNKILSAIVMEFLTKYDSHGVDNRGSA